VDARNGYSCAEDVGALPGLTPRNLGVPIFRGSENIHLVKTKFILLYVT
jgi:hypothetical protein